IAVEPPMNRTIRARDLFLLALLGLTMLRVAFLPATARAGEKPTGIASKYKVRVDRHIQVPMRDGIKLSADLIRPDADGHFPAIIEYTLYRKDALPQGGYAAHYYFAERGFIGVRLDVRGTGSSEGVNTDEYMPVEQKDGFDAVEWCAKQPWSNG